MSEFISKELTLERLKRECNKCSDIGLCGNCAVLIATKEVESIHPADVKPVVYAENVADEYADCDQFICSECGIHLQDWVRIYEEDYQDRIVHEYVFKFCPNCGADVRLTQKLKEAAVDADLNALLSAT